MQGLPCRGRRYLRMVEPPTGISLFRAAPTCAGELAPPEPARWPAAGQPASTSRGRVLPAPCCIAGAWLPRELLLRRHGLRGARAATLGLTLAPGRAGSGLAPARPVFP